MKFDNSNEQYLSLLVLFFKTFTDVVLSGWNDGIVEETCNETTEMKSSDLSSVLLCDVVWKWYSSKVFVRNDPACMRQLNRKDHVTYQFLITRISVSVYSWHKVSLHDKNHVLMKLLILISRKLTDALTSRWELKNWFAKLNLPSKNTLADNFPDSHHLPDL